MMLFKNNNNSVSPCALKRRGFLDRTWTVCELSPVSENSPLFFQNDLKRMKLRLNNSCDTKRACLYPIFRLASPAIWKSRLSVSMVTRVFTACENRRKGFDGGVPLLTLSGNHHSHNKISILGVFVYVYGLIHHLFTSTTRIISSWAESWSSHEFNI